MLLPIVMASLAPLVAPQAPRPVLPVCIAPARAAAGAGPWRFTGAVELPVKPDRALLRVIAQHRYRLRLNGRLAAVGASSWGETHDVARFLKAGRNTAEIDVAADTTPAPENAWVVLERDLPRPMAVEELAFTTAAAARGEWLYVELIDAAGNTSGYYCSERGRPDLMLGTSGAAAQHVIRLKEQPRLEYRGHMDCDLAHVVRLRIRMDRKDTSNGLSGAVRFADLQLRGTETVDLSAAAGWRITPGMGEHRGSQIRPAAAGFALAYDFTPLPDPRLSVDLRAFLGAQEIGRLASGANWTVGGQAAIQVEPPTNDASPIDITDPLETGTKPFEAIVSLGVEGGLDRWPAHKPLALRATLWSLEAHPSTALRLTVQNWAGRTVATAEASAAGDAREAAFRLPGLPRGLYRIGVEVAAASGSPGKPTRTVLHTPERYAALAVLGEGEKRVSALFDTLTPLSRKVRGLQGIDLQYIDSPAMMLTVRDLGVNFLQFHLDPAQLDNGEFDELLAFCKATRLRFALNNETSNWARSAIDKSGHDRFDAANGCHRWDIEPQALRKAAATGLFKGVVYDEGEHMQLSRNAYSELPDKVHRKAYFVETTGKSLPEAYEAYLAAARGIVSYNRSAGATMLVESVFPVLWHPLARAGVTLCPKLLKEDIHPVVLAQALGAAKQYGARLWFTPDLWLMDRLPGHSVREYGMALRLAHLAGVDNVYTEYYTCLGLPREGGYEITPYGRTLQLHIREYLPGHARAYTYRDYEPEVAIVRFPDSDWGQASCYYWNALYGAEDLHSTPETREWLQVWSLLTGGASDPRAVNANSSVYDRYAWHFTVPSRPVAVFDHLVGDAPLATANTFFVCGTAISPESTAAIGRRVRAGAICFVASRLAPKHVRDAAAKLPARVSDGRGAWIVVDGFTPEQLGVYRRLVPPPAKTMRLRFRGKEVGI